MDDLNNKEEKSAQVEQDDPLSVGKVLILFISFCSIIYGMVWTWNGYGCNEQTPDLGFFLLFWAREIIIFGLLGLIFVVEFLSWIFKLLKKLLKDKN